MDSYGVKCDRKKEWEICLKLCHFIQEYACLRHEKAVIAEKLANPRATVGAPIHIRFHLIPKFIILCPKLFRSEDFFTFLKWRSKWAEVLYLLFKSIHIRLNNKAFGKPAIKGGHFLKAVPLRKVEWVERLKGPEHSKNENLYFLAPAQTKWIQPILVSCKALFRSNL